MGYYNPILAYGVVRFADSACAAGVDGLIVPDLPLGEAGQLESACQEHDLALIYLIAPTTPAGQLAKVTAHSTGFVYLVSLTGVTGARSRVSGNLPGFVRRVRMVTNKPLAVGFGISSPDHTRQVGKLADGVIVGSALIDTVSNSKHPANAAGSFVIEMRNALQN
jgi:tryptophan synthase alpha chain